MQNIINKEIISVGANDSERRLFDALVGLPTGTTYNSYIMKGSEKIALIDTVDPSKADVLFKNLSEAGVDNIDYIVINHAEQDHSGSLPLVLDKFPNAKIICTDKCMPMLLDLLRVSEDRFQVVKDKEELSLGDKTLEFIYLPWMHWPETMATYVKEDKILFSCDLFGAHMGADDLLEVDKETLFRAAKIYFAEIMMPFRVILKNNIAKLENYDIKTIAPSHGPMHTEAQAIIDSYKQWISDDVKNLVVIAYVSMHGSTKLLAERLASDLLKNGIEVSLYDVTKMELGDIASDLVDAATVVVGTPCLLGGIHPSMVSLIYLANALRPKTKYLSVVGSYGWMSGIVETIAPMIKNFKAELLTPVIVKGAPCDADFQLIDDLAMSIKNKHSEMNLF